MPEFVRMVLVLFLTCGLAAGSLAIVNGVTRAPIANWESKQQEEALRKVFVAADTFEALPATAAAQGMTIWTASKSGAPVGHIIRTEVQGYSGIIKMMFGLDANKTITGFEILVQTETPGLGAKITTPQFREQFKGKTLEQLVLKKDNPQGAIDAITAATISSRAVTKAVHTALDTFLKTQGETNP